MVCVFRTEKKTRRPEDVFQDPWLVYDLKGNQLQSLKVIRRQEPNLDLNKSFVYDTNEGSFEITFTLDSRTTFSIFRSRSESDASQAFDRMCPIIPSVMKGVIRRNRDKRTLELLLSSITACIRENQGWTPAHVASFLGLHCLFRHKFAEVVEKLNSQSNDTKDSPLHIALKSMHKETVKAILSLHPNLTVINAAGNSILHEASLTSVSFFKITWNSFSVSRNAISDPRKLMAFRNNENRTPVHLACFNDKIDIVKYILTLGLSVHQLTLSPPCQPVVLADPTPETAVVFTREMLRDLDEDEIKHAGCPLHWVKGRKTLDKLLCMGLNPKTANIQMESPVHVFTRRNRLDCLLGVLSNDYTTHSLVTDTEETALHYAVKVDNIPEVQALVVFDSDVNAVDKLGNSPRHLAAGNRTQVSNNILHLLNAVGAERCPEGKTGCEDGCVFDGSFNGVPLEEWPSFAKESFYKEILMQDIIDKSLTELEEKKERDRKIRMLTLDGGGIRGLIAASILCEMDSLLQHPLYNYFDWTVGTSTGSVIASLLCLKYSPQDIRGLYFKMKDHLMIGPKPYCSKRFDTLLKDTFGESIVMNNIKDRKLTITSSIADKIPSELHLFRSYPSPEEVILVGTTEGSHEFQCDKNYLWSACRASGSAPYYFTPHDKYIDGGLVANNPTLDGLTEFILWKESTRSTGKSVPNLGLVINIGTGRMPDLQLEKALEIEGPLYSWNLKKTLRNTYSIWTMVKLLFEQCTMTDHQVVERSMAWCQSMNVPHFRLCPPLSVYHTLDLIEDEAVVKLLFETKAYIHALRPQFLEMVRLIDLHETPEESDRKYKKLPSLL